MRRNITVKIVLICMLTFMSSFALVQTVKAESVNDYRTIPITEWSVVSFYFKEGDHLTVSWHASQNPIDVYVLGEFDYDLFIGGSSFNSLSAQINTYDGYIDLITSNEGVLFTIFLANYSGSSNVFFHVSVLREDGVKLKDVHFRCD